MGCDRAAGRDRVGPALAMAKDDPPVERCEEAFDLEVRRLVPVHVCECTGREVAITTELVEERALGVDRSAARSMFDASEQVVQFVVLLTTFDRERALPDLREHHVGREQLRHGIRPAETLEGHRGDDDSVVFGGALESRRDVAPQAGEREVRSPVSELGTTPG